MRVLLSVVCVTGLAVLFGLSDPDPAATDLVTSSDVQLVSEQMSSEYGPRVAGKNGNSGKNGKGGGGGRRGSVRLARSR